MLVHAIAICWGCRELGFRVATQTRNGLKELLALQDGDALVSTSSSTARVVKICSRDDAALQTALKQLDLAAAATSITKAPGPDLAAAAGVIQKAVVMEVAAAASIDTAVCRWCKQNPKGKGLYGFCSSECRELAKADRRGKH
jgi:hypothetical protein